jgi:hypothetical protein
MAKAVTSEDIRYRFIELFNNGSLNYSDELQIFEAMIERYKLMTISNYARFIKKDYNSVKFLIKNKNLAYMIIDNETFVITGL